MERCLENFFEKVGRAVGTHPATGPCKVGVGGGAAERGIRNLGFLQKVCGRTSFFGFVRGAAGIQLQNYVYTHLWIFFESVEHHLTLFQRFFWLNDASGGRTRLSLPEAFSGFLQFGVFPPFRRVFGLVGEEERRKQAAQITSMTGMQSPF